jgi:hypothetical protein
VALADHNAHFTDIRRLPFPEFFNNIGHKQKFKLSHCRFDPGSLMPHGYLSWWE